MKKRIFILSEGILAITEIHTGREVCLQLYSGRFPGLQIFHFRRRRFAGIWKWKAV